MPYQKSTNNNGVTFDVQPEPYINPTGGGFKWISGCLLILGAIIIIGAGFGTGSTIGIIIFGTIGVGMLFLFRKTLKTPNKVKEMRVAKKFTANAEGIVIDGKKYKKEDIQFISVRNPMLDQQFNQMPYVNHGNEEVANAMHAQKMQAATVNYWVVMETNGTPVFLGCGLNELAANAIKSDVSNILGMKIS